MMDKAAIKDFESWSNDEPTISSTTVIASEELPVRPLLGTIALVDALERFERMSVVSTAVSTDGDTATFLESDLFVYTLYVFVRQL